ncbi:MFS transporter [Streptomyces sp. NPDC051576]|uniref:MFS transporter n=1 Tax=Streptomyces sp. NPDC051576 TaxID=3155803 RepID=UPI00343B7E66
MSLDARDDRDHRDHRKTAAAGALSGGSRYPGVALAILATTQLMVVLDGTIVNIALPSVQSAFGISADRLAWIVNAYALAFGGLMLVGGRAGDLFGRRRTFRAGIVLFTLASLLGGLAPNAGLLIAARVAQGAGAAVAAPTALSLIATTFPEGRSRNRAMGVYGAMAGLGSTIGLLLGGVLTEYLDWRWVLLVNVPIGVAVLAGTVVLGEGDRGSGRLDLPGAVTGTGGMLSLVYGITRGGRDGWTDGVTLACFAAAAVLLAVFLVLQARGRHPMLPLRVLRNRDRAGSYGVMLCVGVGMFATFYFLTLYMQQVLGYGAARAGLAYLPFSIGMGATAGIVSKLVAKVPPRLLTGPGLCIAAAGMFWLSTLTPGSSYATRLAPAMFVTAIGLGCCFVPMTLSAVSGVARGDSGIASAMLNTSQQIGGALGLAALTTLANSAADDRLPHAAQTWITAVRSHRQDLVVRAVDAMTHGYTSAFTVGSLVFLAGALVAGLAITTGRQDASGAAKDSGAAGTI